jgi:hypothetical protein
VIERIGFVALIVTAASLVSQASQEAFQGDHIGSSNPRYVIMANYMRNHGLRPGGKVAVIGDGMYTYWAHLDRLQVVAEIPSNIRHYQDHPAVDFWASGPEQQREWLRILAQTGAEVVVADPQGLVRGFEPSVVPAPWKKIEGTDAYVYFLGNP